MKFKKDDLIKFKSIHSPVIWYIRVDGFYTLNDGGTGFEYTFLAGFGNGSEPLASVEQYKHFPTLREMQNDIDNGQKLIF